MKNFSTEDVRLISKSNLGLTANLLLVHIGKLHISSQQSWSGVECPIWQYGLWSFQTTKLKRFLPKNQHTQRKLLNFENWVNGEVSKIGHHFRK